MRISTVFLLFFCSASFAQNQSENQSNNKGDIYFYWGWNRSNYSLSDIHFSGSNYNFTLTDVVARDRQTPFAPNIYLNPAHATIPQYNFRVGYFLKKNHNISLGIDHMKYVVQQNQEVRISGYIENSDTDYDGIYETDKITITPAFLLFEHTDGLNYINLEYRRIDEVVKKKNISLQLTEGIGTGFLLPKTNTTLLNIPRYDEFHLSGFGINGVLGIIIQFGEHLFISSEAKGGYINMPSIKTSNQTSDRASQSFFFGQVNIVFGVRLVR